MRLVKSNTPKICKECNGSLLNTRALSKHLRRRRAQGFCPPVRVPVILKPTINKHKVVEYNCIHCKKTFKQERGLHLHGRRYLNGSCKLKFPSLYRTEEEGGIKTYICNNCDAEYTIYRSIQNHIQRFRKEGVCPGRNASRDMDTGAVSNNKTCQYCGHEFVTRGGMLRHSAKYDPITGCAPTGTQKLNAKSNYINTTVTDKNTVIYECKNCKEIFHKHSSILSHLRFLVDGKCADVLFLPGEELQPFIEDRVKCQNPFQLSDVFFDEPQQLGSTEHIAGLDRMTKWIKAYKKEKDRVYAQQFHGVYCVAVLGKQFQQGLNIREFIRNNPSQVIGTYWGSCVNSYLPISKRHVFFPKMSNLAKAAMSGFTIVVLGHVDVENHHQNRLQRVKKLEAVLIAQSMVDAEYVPVAGKPQYPILNVNSETSTLLEVPEHTMREAYRRGISGIQLICLDDHCDRTCASVCHPDWESDLVFQLKKEIEKYHPNIKLEPFIPNTGYKSKRQRPINEGQLQKAIEQKIQGLVNFSRTYDPSHYMYTVIVVPSNKFPRNWGARRICRELIKQKDENLMVGVYVGVNSSPKPADYHTNENKHHSSILKSVQKGGIPIVINIKKFESKLEARENEATFIAYNSILQRWKVDGIKFELLNEHQEWKYLPLSNPTFKEKVGQALAGRQYVSLDGEGIIDLNAQVRGGKVSLMEI